MNGSLLKSKSPLSGKFKLHIDKKTTVVAEQHGEIKHGETKCREKVGYNEGRRRKVSYWFSYDRNLLTLKYGKGYRMTETTIMEHNFLKGLTPDEQRAKREELHYLFSPEIHRIIEQYDAEEEKTLRQIYQNKLLKGMTLENKCLFHPLGPPQQFMYTKVSLMQQQPTWFNPTYR